jgi:cytochrome c peroxidase
MHNGIFDTLEEAVEFYNSRDVDDKWGEPEVASTVNREELGDLKLSEQEVADIVAFLKTLTDGYRPD